MSALKLIGVRKAFGLTEIIRGTDLEVHEGERVALIGPNGAGKSTLFGLISGGLKPDAGSIRVLGTEMAGKPPYLLSRAGLGRSFQVSSLFANLSVRENLTCASMWTQGQRLGLMSVLNACRPLRGKVDALLGELGLAGRATARAGDLSYAEQRVLEIGIAVAADPRILLLDEPTSGMSRAETGRVIDLIRKFSAGRTLVMIEHDMNVVFDLADRVAVLVYGQVIAFDRPEAIRANPDVQSAYLGQHVSQQHVAVGAVA